MKDKSLIGESFRAVEAELLPLQGSGTIVHAYTQEMYCEITGLVRDVRVFTGKDFRAYGQGSVAMTSNDLFFGVECFSHETRVRLDKALDGIIQLLPWEELAEFTVIENILGGVHEFSYRTFINTDQEFGEMGLLEVLDMIGRSKGGRLQKPSSDRVFVDVAKKLRNFILENKVLTI